MPVDVGCQLNSATHLKRIERESNLFHRGRTRGVPSVSRRTNIFRRRFDRRDKTLSCFTFFSPKRYRQIRVLFFFRSNSFEAVSDNDGAKSVTLLILYLEMSFVPWTSDKTVPLTQFPFVRSPFIRCYISHV